MTATFKCTDANEYNSLCGSNTIKGSPTVWKRKMTCLQYDATTNKWGDKEANEDMCHNGTKAFDSNGDETEDTRVEFICECPKPLTYAFKLSKWKPTQNT